MTGVLLKLPRGRLVLAQDWIGDAYTQTTGRNGVAGSVHENAGAAILEYATNRRASTPPVVCTALGGELVNWDLRHGRYPCSWACNPPYVAWTFGVLGMD